MIVPIANQNIIQLDMQAWAAKPSQIATFDIVPFLEQGFLLREVPFRNALEAVDWKTFSNKHVNIICSNQAIVPLWAYMLLGSYLESEGAVAYFQHPNIEEAVLIANFLKSDFTPIVQKRVMLKGCSQKNIGPGAYIFIAQHLQKIVKSLAYGESCSSVPIYKN